MSALPRLVLAAAGCMVLVACALADGPAAQALADPSVTARARAWADVQALRGDAACSADAQCHSIGVGSKACGGPSAYLAWSDASTDGRALAAAVQRHAELARAAQQAARRASTCAIEPDPGAVCAGTAPTHKRCELRPR